MIGSRRVKGSYHQNNQRLCVGYDSLIKNGRVGFQRHVHCFEVMRHQPLRKNAPVLIVKMGIKLRGDDVCVRQRLHREKEHVCN